MTSHRSTHNGSNVVVTGVSSGIGREIARFLAGKGYRVFGSVRKAADADKLVQELDDCFHPLIFDVCDRAAVDEAAAMVRSVIKDEPLLALINNAGLALFGPMEHLDDDAFEHIIQVNLIGTRIVTNAFLPLLRGDYAQSDRRQSTQVVKIVNVSSLSGIFNTPMNGAYCVSKHAMESLGEIYRRELMSTNVDVVAIRSGPIQSEIWRKNLDEGAQYEGTIYEAQAKTSQKIMRSAQRGALPADVIARLVWDIIEGRKKRISYEVGRGAKISRLFSSSLMPRRLADRLIHKTLNKPVLPKN